MKCAIFSFDMHSSRRNLHRAFGLLIGVLYILSGCGSGTGSNSLDPQPAAKWTVMVYMAADSDISEAAVRNINDMEEIGSTGEVNVIVQAEFSKAFSPLMPENTVRGRISKDNDREVIGSTLYDLGNLDMTDPGTLSDFIRWASTKYPAEHHAIVLWSHGLGWKANLKGMMEDVSSAGDNHIMPLPELARAIRESGVRFDLIDFDACLMGMYEVAYEMKGLTDYVTFSEALFPASGNPYGPILYELTVWPDMDGGELAHALVAACRDYYKAVGLSFAKSAVRSSQIDHVHSLVMDLANSLINNMTGGSRQIYEAIDNTTDYYSYVYRDLGDFLRQLKTRTDDEEILSTAASLEGALGNLIVDNQVYSPGLDDPIMRSQGLAIYLPAPGLNISRDFLRYSELSCNQGDGVRWADFVLMLSAYP